MGKIHNCTDIDVGLRITFKSDADFIEVGHKSQGATADVANSVIDLCSVQKIYMATSLYDKRTWYLMDKRTWYLMDSQSR